MINRSIELECLYEITMSRRSVVFHAPSGMGKSTMVNQLKDKLQGRRFCFDINVRGLQNERQFLHRLLQTLTEKAQSSYNLQYQLKRIIEERPVPTDIHASSLSSWIEAILVGLQNVSLDFLFIIEDADQWEGNADIAEFVRPFSQSRNSHALITSTTAIEALPDFVSNELPPLTLENLDADLKTDNSISRLEKVLALSDGNTRFFKHLVEAGALKAESPNQSLQIVLERNHTMYYNFRNRFTDLQWRLLLAIANEGRVAQPHSFEFLVNYRLGAASSVERALRNLSDTKIIQQSEGGWRVSQIEFQRWLEWLYPHNVEAVVLQ